MSQGLPESVKGLTLFFVGIKGTGMSALADLFAKAGAIVSGSDIPEEFYTDKVLQDLGIPYVESFDDSLLPNPCDLVVYSSAYNKETNPQLAKAAALSIPALTYTQALGLYSSRFYSCGVCGVHGKTTTTGLVGSIMKTLNLPASVLVGSALPIFDNRSIWSGGDDFFVAETCEYQRHFLDFFPGALLLTSSEADHLDYFKDANDVDLAFVEFCRKLPEKGILVYCADDDGACRVKRAVEKECKENNRALQFIPYGFSASGDYQITSMRQEDGATYFKMAACGSELKVHIPGRHLVLNSAGAIALLVSVLIQQGKNKIELEALICEMGKGLSAYTGSRRRSEIVGEANGILVIDDYAHHPTAIDTTLAGFREFYPNRRIIVDFMSHTYSRTEGLLEEFASSFANADIVLLNKIYASAREVKGNITGETLYERTKEYHDEVLYYNEYLDAIPWLLEHLKPGDLFVTMGAGDNWQLGRALLKKLNKETYND